MKPWKKLHLKSTIKCFKKVKMDKWSDLSCSFSPIDCCVSGKPDGLFSQWWYSVIIHLDSDRINFRTFVSLHGCLSVYWSIWTSSFNTDIKFHQFLNRVSSMLNNVFNWSHSYLKQQRVRVSVMVLIVCILLMIHVIIRLDIFTASISKAQKMDLLYYDTYSHVLRPLNSRRDSS